MGKRKKSSRKPQGPKKREPLPTAFPCLFCNHEKSVTVKLEKKIGVGQLSCKVCGQSFQTGINYLSAAVDVYSDWIDACDTVAKDAADANPATTYRDVDAGPSGSALTDRELDRHAARGSGIDDDDEEGDEAYGDE